VHPKATNTHKENGWLLLEDGGPSQILTHVVVDRILARVPKQRLIAFGRDYSNDVSIELSVIVRIASAASIPSVAFTPDHLAFLADCGASVDIDIYMP
jgi:hypothetical protein